MARWGPRLSEISPYERVLLKNQNLFIRKQILPPNKDPTFLKPGSRFGKMFFFHINILLTLQGPFCLYSAYLIFLKIAENHSTKNVIKTVVKLMSCWPIFSKKLFTKTKKVHGATHVENNMGSKVEGNSCSKDKEEKHVLDGVVWW